MRATRGMWSAVLGALLAAGAPAGLRGQAAAGETWKPAKAPLMTWWGQDVNAREPRREYPRPRLCRNIERQSINGLWEYAVVPAADTPPEAYPGKLLVPFPLESALSGVGRPLGAGERLWLRLRFELPKHWVPSYWSKKHARTLLLHFGAVRGDATVWLNATELGKHADGDDSLTFDVHEPMQERGTQELVVAVSPTARPGAGIWQTVWLEAVPRQRIEDLTLVPDPSAGALRVTVQAVGCQDKDRVEVSVLDGGSEAAQGAGRPGEEIVLPIRDARCWTPAQPVVYEVRVALWREKGRLDAVTGFTGLRSVSVEKDADRPATLKLNGGRIFLWGVEDAGWWPDGGLAAPSYLAMRADVELMRQLGFNLVRKTGKVEPDWWYYWCDRVGLAVFQELPVGKQGLTEGARRLLQSLRHHPSLLAWIVRGEGRGAEETAVLVSELRKLDATRLVYVLGGPCGDFLAADAARVGERGKEAGRNGQALVVEAGGTAFAVPSHTWEGDARGGADPAEGYRRLYGQAAEWTERPGVAAVIYRQFADVAGECTGLVTADREVVKVNVAEGLMPRGLAEPKATTLIPAEKVEWGKDGALWRKEYGGERPLDEPWVAVRGTAQGSVSLNGGQVGRLEPTGGATLLRRLHHEARQRVSVVRNTLSVKANKPADDALLDIGLVGMAPVERRLPATLRILMDVWMRDTSICTGPDGTYYLTGTGGTPRGWFSDGIYVWKSRDLKAWEPLGQVWSLAKDSTWQLKGRQLAQTQLWAPEIHYAKGSFWLTYCTSYPPGPGVTNGCGLLRSTTGKPEGPYTDVKPDAPFARELDGSLFEDDDGTVYYLYGGCHIAKMKDDMSGLAEGFRQIGPAEGGPVGFEGISLFKANGKYYLSAAACPLPEENYDCMTAVGDSVYGPYRKHHVSVPRGGHNVFFKDRDGQWWSTYFGGDRNGPFWEKPALLRVEFAPDGTIHPLGPARP